MSGIVSEFIRKSVRRGIGEAIPGVVEKVMAERFAEWPDKELTEIGFRWAFALRIRHHWPDVALKDASYWLNDYMPSRFGDPEYDWSARAAQELADEYVMEFGEGK